MDWSVTKKKLCIFIPNYKRGFYIMQTIGQYLQTTLPLDDYSVIIGNDGYDPSLNIAALPNNFHVFTVKRENDSLPRNGCYIRNLFIKNCQSDWIIQKDPEIILQPLDRTDWIRVIAESTSTNTLYRCSHIRMLEENPTLHILNRYQMTDLQLDPVDHHKHFHMHHLFGVPTKTLKEMQGYDERFMFYGPEDQDMLDRLLAHGFHQQFLNVGSIHLFHPREIFSTRQEHFDMVNLFSKFKAEDFVRNKDGKWGELEYTWNK